MISDMVVSSFGREAITWYSEGSLAQRLVLGLVRGWEVLITLSSPDYWLTLAYQWNNINTHFF